MNQEVRESVEEKLVGERGVKIAKITRIIAAARSEGARDLDILTLDAARALVIKPFADMPPAMMDDAAEIAEELADEIMVERLGEKSIAYAAVLITTLITGLMGIMAHSLYEPSPNCGNPDCPEHGHLNQPE